MSEKKLIAVYKQLVYSDGSVVMEQIPVDSEENNSNTSDDSSLSARIKQALEFIEYFMSIYNAELGEDYCWTSSVKEISSRYGIREPSVVDKVTRQLGHNTAEMKEILVKLCEDNSPDEIIGILKKNAPNSVSKPFDLRAIDEFFKK